MISPTLPVRDEEVVILVLGPTGSGKSSFINLVSGSDIAISDTFKSCTTNVQMSNTFELDGRPVVLVDTPGFDDTPISDMDILKRIAVYLASTYEAGFKLSGVIYLHRITDNRVGVIARRNFRMLRQLCGDDTLRNVAIVTSMWDQVSMERGLAREEELQSDELLFKPVIEKGATMLRHDNSLQAARAIIRHLVKKRPQSLQIQLELVQDKKDISETLAGVELQGELHKLMERHRAEIETLKQEMWNAIASKDPQTRQELEETRQGLGKRLRILASEKDRISREYRQEKDEADRKIRELVQAYQQARQFRVAKEAELECLRAFSNNTETSQKANRASQPVERRLFKVNESEELATTKRLLEEREEVLAAAKQLLTQRDEELAMMRRLSNERDKDLTTAKQLLREREEELVASRQRLERFMSDPDFNNPKDRWNIPQILLRKIEKLEGEALKAMKERKQTRELLARQNKEIVKLQAALSQRQDQGGSGSAVSDLVEGRWRKRRQL